VNKNDLLAILKTVPRESDETQTILELEANLTPILHLVENFDTGGLERFVLDLAWGQMAKNQKVLIGFTHLGGQMEKEALSRGFEVYQLSNFDDLKGLITNQNISTCFIHHSYLHLNLELLNLVRVVEVLHNPYWWQAENTGLMSLRREMESIVCVSKYVADYAIEVLNVKEELVHIIPNAILKTGEEQLRTKSGKIFLNVANFAPQKNHLLLVKSFIEFCTEMDDYDYELWLVGQNLYSNLGPHIEKLLTKNRRVKIKIFHTFVSEELHSIYKEASFYIMPSTFEGFSLASLEALSFGLPTAISGCGGVYEIKKHLPDVVKIPGITPANSILNKNYIDSTCWNPTEDQIASVKSAIIELSSIKRIDFAAVTFFDHSIMVDKYQRLIRVIQ